MNKLALCFTHQRKHTLCRKQGSDISDRFALRSCLLQAPASPHPASDGLSPSVCSFFARSKHKIIKKSPSPVSCKVCQEEKKKEKTCLYVIFSVIVNENDFNSLSFPARLDITGIPRPAKFLADRTNCPRILRGVRYSRFLIGASWLDTHHPWGEACNTVGLCWHVFDSGKEKQKQIL